MKYLVLRINFNASSTATYRAIRSSYASTDTYLITFRLHPNNGYKLVECPLAERCYLIGFGQFSNVFEREFKI